MNASAFARPDRADGGTLWVLLPAGCRARCDVIGHQALYANGGLAAVMASAVVFNLVVAAIAGVAIPIALHATGRDPAQGSSVLLTFTNDATDFFLFLGLAQLFLV